MRKTRPVAAKSDRAPVGLAPQGWWATDLRIGISGWTYPPWRGVFYPKDLPQLRELDRL